ncbi:12291_t:CDS:2, partial [Funneliformis geosporum]
CKTTIAEKYNLNLIAEFVSKKGFGIKYGILILCILPAWIGIIRNVMKPSSERNFPKKRTRLKWIKSGTSYLKIAYEEVLFSICFTGKKKYFRVGHEDIVNFKLKKLFMKGIETVKQGKSQLLKFIGEKIMREAIDINNMCPIHKIVENTFRETQNKE